MQIKQHITRLRHRYLQGPDWVEMPTFIDFKGYRSRTALLLLWLYAFYVRLFTIPGRMVLSVSMLVVAFSMVAVQSPVRELTFTLVAIFSIDLLAGYIFRPKLKIERNLTKRARVGSPVRLEYRVTNERRLPAWDIAIDVGLPRRGIRIQGSHASVDQVPPKETVTLQSVIVPERRGKFILQAPMADSTFPFCIFQWSCRRSSAQELLVYPPYEPLTMLNLPVGQRYQQHGNTAISKVGESPDFLGCREFRVGDDPRHIHWPSSARAGELIVREYQEEFLSRVAVVLDTYADPPGLLLKLMNKQQISMPFEAALSLTAALADYLSRGDYVIDIFAAGPNVYHFQGGRSLGYFDNMLDILACMEPNHEHPISELSPTVMEEVSSIGSAIVVVLKWDDARRQLVQNLHDHGVAVKVIYVTEGKGEDGPDEAIILRPEEIFRGGVTSL